MYAELIADNLVNVATGRGKGVVAAVMQIADRTEGRPFQSIGVEDITRDLRDRSDEDIQFYLDHGCWPEDRRLTRCNRLRWHRTGKAMSELLFLGVVATDEIKKKSNLGLTLRRLLRNRLPKNRVRRVITLLKPNQ